jgi:flagellar basal body rod protein FlgG
MTANSKWQDIVAQNLASASVPGYKKLEVSFDAVQAGVLGGSGARNALTFPHAQISTNYSSGEMKYTGSVTDLAIQGNGFFVVETSDGATGYTRDGEFQIDSKGQLVTKSGDKVVADQGSLQINQRDSSPINISSTGVVSQGGQMRGKLKVVEFSDPSRLQSAGGGIYTDANNEAQASTQESPELRQGYLESANTSAVNEMTSLISAMRAFETNQRVVQMQDDRMGRAISELGNPS